MTFVQKELLHDNYGGDKMQVEKAPQFIRKEDVLEHGIEKFKILTESKLNEGTYGTELVCEIYAIRKSHVLGIESELRTYHVVLGNVISDRYTNDRKIILLFFLSFSSLSHIVRRIPISANCVVYLYLIT